jgi:hypothetical protein
MDYYLLTTHDGMPGLDRTRDALGLIRTVAAAAAQRRNWMVLPEGETPAVDLAALPARWQPGFRRQLGSLTLLRFDRAD